MWERWRVWEHSLGVTTAGVHTARFTRSQFPEVSTSLWTRSVGCVLSPATLRHVFVLTGDSFVPPLTGPRRPSLPGPPSQPRRERDVYGSPTPPRARVEPTSAGSRPTPCIHTLVVLSSCGTRDGSSGSRGAAVATGACTHACTQILTYVHTCMQMYTSPLLAHGLRHSLQYVQASMAALCCSTRSHKLQPCHLRPYSYSYTPPHSPHQPRSSPMYATLSPTA